MIHFTAQQCCWYCIVWWGVIVVSSCPLEGDTCAAIITNWALRPRPPIHPSLCSTVALFWLFVNETWLLRCPIWWRHGTIENAVFSYPRCPIWWQRQKTKSQLHETNGFWVQIIQSGPWDQILGSSGSNVIQHCGQSTRESSHLRISSWLPWGLVVAPHVWKPDLFSSLMALSNNIQISCVSVRELGINLRNCVSSNPHFFRRDRSRDRSLGQLDKLLSGGGDKLLGKYLEVL